MFRGGDLEPTGSALDQRVCHAFHGSTFIDCPVALSNCPYSCAVKTEGDALHHQPSLSHLVDLWQGLREQISVTLQRLEQVRCAVFTVGSGGHLGMAVFGLKIGHYGTAQQSTLKVDDS